MKVAKRAQKVAIAQAAADIMTAHNFNPIERLMALVDEEIEAPDDEGTQRSMLCTDYEPSPVNPGHFRYRARLRGEWLMELARYAHPRMRSTDTAGKGPVAVMVEIKNYASPEVTILEARS